jgi:hypothetical protein
MFYEGNTLGEENENDIIDFVSIQFIYYLIYLTAEQYRPEWYNCYNLHRLLPQKIWVQLQG